MGFIYSAGFEQLVGAYRLLWIRGKFGSGKTAVAFKIAEHFLKRGYRLVTNTPSVWNDGLVEINQEGLLHAVIIVDEAGLGLKVKQQLEAMAAYARKMDAIYIFPSFFPPTRSAQVVTLQPLFSLMQIGLPLSVLEWRVNMGGFKDKGFFLWAFPSETWGVYDTSAPEGAIDEIINHLAEQVQKFRTQKGVARSDELSALGTGFSQVDAFADSVDALSEAVDSLSSVSTRRVRTRRI
jgi:hypothetical protein